MSGLKAGRELDAAVAEAIGAKPEIQGMISSDGGKSGIIWLSSVESAENWLERKQASGLFVDQGFAALPWRIYPAYSTDPAASADIKRWLTVECCLVLMTETDAFGCHAWVWTDKNVSGKGATEPEAIALLALAVAQEQPR